ncbi:MAG: heat-inducible transcriptional repressor HrcA [Coriobacteriia bacterium]|nr:heat-inducible transcriptional repressor HrcA [Coriobacteriia bacterium]
MKARHVLNERRRRVLVALVEEHIASAQPVGSKTLVDRYELGCSPATVRNELAILEETGFVVQPHVSAGRLPTDTGYRDFVDSLLEDEASASLGREPTPIPQAAEIDDLMRATSALLTKLTDTMAVILAPSVLLTRVKRINLVPMADTRVLFVLITDSGQVLNHYVELKPGFDASRLSGIEQILNETYVGKRAAEIAALEESFVCDPADAEVIDAILAEILEVMKETDRGRLFHVGIPALLSQPEFHDSGRARSVLECVEDGFALLEAMSAAFESQGMTVRIGHENARKELGGLSVVAVHYGTSNSDGVVGVIGPTRMDYKRAIDAVSAVADGLSGVLG